MNLLLKYFRTRWKYIVILVIFILINYSYFAWNLFNRIGGLGLAKAAPEGIGIIFLIVLSKISFKKWYPDFHLELKRRDCAALVIVVLSVLIFHFKEFSRYFYRDDIYFWLNRIGTSYSVNGYSVYLWGPWLSSHSGLMWEIVRSFSGFNVFGYQVGAIFSYCLLSAGVYFLAKELTKSFKQGLFITMLVATTSINFEAFQWLSHNLSFGWQALLFCLCLTVLVWELRRNKGRYVNSSAVFLWTAVLGGGIARFGPGLGVISVVDIIVSLRLLGVGKFLHNLKYFLLRESIFYFVTVLFFTIRGLWTVGKTRPEIVTAPVYKIFLYLIGVFSYPPEITYFISNKLNLLPGMVTVFAGVIFFMFIPLAYLFLELRKKRMADILGIGYLWVIINAFYFTLFGPHVPVSDLTINAAHGSHALSYFSCIGALFIWGYLLFQIVKRVVKIKLFFGAVIMVVVIVGSYLLISKDYDNFLQIPVGQKVTIGQFFFETYLKYIPVSADEVNIYYDDGYLVRKDNFRVGEDFIRGYWNTNSVKTLFGDEQLVDYLANVKGETRKERIDSLYNIFTDYYASDEENLSMVLRTELKKPSILSIIGSEQVIEGRRFGNKYLLDTDLPIIFFMPLKFPAMLNPELDLKFRISKYGSVSGGTKENVLPEIISDRLPDVDLTKSKSVCDPIDDKGVTFFVSWVGATDNYFERLSKDERDNFFSSKYKERFWVLCHISKVEGVIQENIKITDLGNYIRGILIVPLSKNYYSMQIQTAILKEQEIFNRLTE